MVIKTESRVSLVYGYMSSCPFWQPCGSVALKTLIRIVRKFQYPYKAGETHLSREACDLFSSLNRPLGFERSFKVTSIMYINLVGKEKQTLGSISCITTTFCSLQPISFNCVPLE